MFTKFKQKLEKLMRKNSFIICKPLIGCVLNIYDFISDWLSVHSFSQSNPSYVQGEYPNGEYYTYDFNLFNTIYIVVFLVEICIVVGFWLFNSCKNRDEEFSCNPIKSLTYFVLYPLWVSSEEDEKDIEKNELIIMFIHDMPLSILALYYILVIGWDTSVFLSFLSGIFKFAYTQSNKHDLLNEFVFHYLKLSKQGLIIQAGINLVFLFAKLFLWTVLIDHNVLWLIALVILNIGFIVIRRKSFASEDFPMAGVVCMAPIMAILLLPFDLAVHQVPIICDEKDIDKIDNDTWRRVLQWSVFESLVLIIGGIGVLSFYSKLTTGTTLAVLAKVGLILAIISLVFLLMGLISWRRFTNRSRHDSTRR